MKSVWRDAIHWMKAMDSRLPSAYPSELPPLNSPDFWFSVSKFEIATRDTVSAKVRFLVKGEELPAMTPLEAWLYRRRVEWAGQLCLAGAQKGEPDLYLHQVLDWLLIESWEREGCIALWNHAERGGKPHPENPDGLTPI
jgi:hypothetical protein